MVEGAPDPAPDARFRKTDRLLRRADIVRVQQTGHKFRTRRLLVTWLPSAVGHTRLGVTVSHKVGNAPNRSTVKRWIREAFRQHKAAWPAAVDIVVIARPPAAAAGYHRILADLLDWAEDAA